MPAIPVAMHHRNEYTVLREAERSFPIGNRHRTPPYLAQETELREIHEADELWHDHKWPRHTVSAGALCAIAAGGSADRSAVRHTTGSAGRRPRRRLRARRTAIRLFRQRRLDVAVRRPDLERMGWRHQILGRQGWLDLCRADV